MILSPERAVAIGEKREAEDVYKLWARKRQTNESPQDRPFTDRPWVIAAMTSFVATFGIMLGVSQQIGHRPWWTHLIVGIILFVPIAAFSRLLIFAVEALQKFAPRRYLPKNMPSYAVIHPYSLDEYRKNKSANKYPKLQTIVSVISAIVAAVAIYFAWIKP